MRTGDEPAVVDRTRTASSAWTDRTSRPAGRSSASETSRAIAIAACSDVPQPVATTGRPASTAARISLARASSPSPWPAVARDARRPRLGGDHLAHDVRRARSERRHARRRPRLGGAGQRLGRRAWHRRLRSGLRTMSATMIARGDSWRRAAATAGSAKAARSAGVTSPCRAPAVGGREGDGRAG